MGNKNTLPLGVYTSVILLQQEHTDACPSCNYVLLMILVSKPTLPSLLDQMHMWGIFKLHMRKTAIARWMSARCSERSRNLSGINCFASLETNVAAMITIAINHLYLNEC